MNTTNTTLTSANTGLVQSAEVMQQCLGMASAIHFAVATMAALIASISSVAPLANQHLCNELKQDDVDLERNEKLDSAYTNFINSQKKYGNGFTEEGCNKAGFFKWLCAERAINNKSVNDTVFAADAKCSLNRMGK